MISIIINKEVTPTQNDLKKALGNTFTTWQELSAFAKKAHPKAIAAWNFSGAKYGWSFRIKDNKRVILYLLPRDNYFKVAFVFGQTATDEIYKSNISESIKNAVQKAKVYAEGRGIRIDVTDKILTNDIKTLIMIKVSN